jgi:A/G-specific adenine glycosylase
MHCKPKNPSCETCIFSNSCASAFNPELIAARPSKLNKTKQSNRYFSYLVCVENQTTFVVKREKPGIWQNLYEFPLLETETEALEAYPILYSSKHILSHQIIHATFYRVPKIALNPFENTAVSLTELHQLPTHRLTEKFLAHAELHHLFEK